MQPMFVRKLEDSTLNTDRPLRGIGSNEFRVNAVVSYWSTCLLYIDLCARHFAGLPSALNLDAVWMRFGVAVVWWLCPITASESGEDCQAEPSSVKHYQVKRLLCAFDNSTLQRYHRYLLFLQTSLPFIPFTGNVDLCALSECYGSSTL